MSAPRILVQKFGGTSVSSPDRRKLVVEHVRRARDEGYGVATVVSAMGRRGDPYATDTLLDLLRAEGDSVRPSDYTLMFVTGEIISAALMSWTLNRAGIPAAGLTGAQARIFTDGHPTEADIVEIDVSRLRAHLERGEVPVVTGGQGIVRDTFDFNTLGRGASDTSGVAVGVALGAERVEIFTDVEGVASADPRVVPGARTIRRISFPRMYELARYGAKVVHPRAVKAGWMGRTPIVVRSTFSSGEGTRVDDAPDASEVSGVAALAPLHTVKVAGTLDAEILAHWERQRLVMHLCDARSGVLILGCADGTALAAALEEEDRRPVEDVGASAWVSVIGDTAANAARLERDLQALASSGVRVLAYEQGRFRSTFVVSLVQAADAAAALHAVAADSLPPRA
jgi:aspartate kinase